MNLIINPRTIFQCRPKGLKFLGFLLGLSLGFSPVIGQVVEAGIHVGYSFSRLTVDRNSLNDQIFVKGGKPFSGFIIGAQAMVGPPKEQSTANFRIISSLLLETSLCRCGGNIELSETTPNGVRTFNELTYLIYRGEYSAKYVAGIKRMHLMIGPMLSTRYYTAVKIGASEGYKYAGDQFRTLAFGYELGIGSKLNRVFLSARYNRFLGAYGKKSDLIPTAYKHWQMRFMLSYYFLQRSKDKNWGSIYWD